MKDNDNRYERKVWVIHVCKDKDKMYEKIKIRSTCIAEDNDKRYTKINVRDIRR